MPDELPKSLMQIIGYLNEDQLHRLYQVITERLNVVHKARALSAMRKFHVLDRVSFTHDGKQYAGQVTRLNQRTVTVTLEDGNRWNVSPGALNKISRDNPLKELLTK